MVDLVSGTNRETVFIELGNGVTTSYSFKFNLGYLTKSDIYVYTGEHADYANQLVYTWVNDTTIELALPIAAGTKFYIRRIVNRDNLNHYFENASLHPRAIDSTHLQLLMLSQEIMDGFGDLDGLGNIKNILDMRGFNITNMAEGVNPADAVTFAQLGGYTDEITAIGDAALATLTETIAEIATAMIEFEAAKVAAVAEVEAVSATALDAADATLADAELKKTEIGVLRDETQVLRDDAANFDIINKATLDTKADKVGDVGEAIVVPVSADVDAPAPELALLRYSVDKQAIVVGDGTNYKSLGGSSVAWRKDDSNVITAQVGEGYIVDTSVAGGHTINLPTAPLTESLVGISDYLGTASPTNPIYLTSLSNIHGTTDGWMITTPNTSLTFMYVDAMMGYKVIEGLGEGGGGTKRNIVQTHLIEPTTQSIAANTASVILGLEAEITTLSVGSGVLVTARWAGEVSANNAQTVFGLLRDGVEIGGATVAGARSTGLAGISQGYYNVDNSSTMDSTSFTYLDYPNKLGTVKYSVTIKVSLAQTIANQRTADDTNAVAYERLTSTIIAEEV